MSTVEYVEPRTNFSKGVVGKEGFTFFCGGGERTVGGSGAINFHIKNKLKSEIFNDKKVYKQKIFFSVITKNLNWEILTKN